MKKFVIVVMIIALMVLMVSSIFAQGTSGVNTRLVHQAGVQLETYSSQFYTAYWMGLGGNFALFTGLTLIHIAPTAGMVLAGLGLLLDAAGGFLNITNAKNIGLAGQSLVSASGY